MLIFVDTVQCVCLCSSMDLALCGAEKESEEFCPGATLSPLLI